MPTRRRLAVIMPLALVTVVPPLAAQAPHDQFCTQHSALCTRLESAVHQFLEERSVPGAAIGIVQDGKLVYAQGFGVRSVERKEPVTKTTIFQIGSVSKVFASTLLLRLRDEGVVALDDPVSKYLPDHVTVPIWEEGAERTAITLRHLATHTAGLPPNPPNRRNRPNSPSVMEPYSVAELYQGLAQTTLSWKPGTQWRYSNYGFGLLGHALERASGQPYVQLVTTKLLHPFGMQDTKITLTEQDHTRFASHYWPNAPRMERERWMFGEVAAFGGLASTVPDLARFVLLHLNATAGSQGIVSGSTLLEMRKPVYTGDDGGTTLGWFYDMNERVGLVLYHGGEVDGHSSHISLAPAVDTAIIVLTNVGGDTAQALHGRVVPVVVAALD